MDTKIKPLRIGIDIDDTLREFMSTLYELLKKNIGYREYSPIPTWGLTNIEFPLNYDISKLWRKAYINELIINAKPCEGAIEGFAELRYWADSYGAKLICVTNQSNETLTPTIEWIGKHNFRFDELHFVKNKTDVDIDFLIDDSPKYYDEWICAGKGKHKFIMVDQPYNKQIWHDIRIKNMMEAKKKILTLI